MKALPLFHALAGRTVIVLGEGEAAAAKRRLVERAGAVVSGDEGAEARLAFVAIDDAGAAEAAVLRLKARGVLVNATDRPALCDFTVPSIVDRNPVIVAVGTGGASAGLAKAVRLRIERMLPQGLGALADALQAARGAIRARWPEAADRRRALDAALDEGGVLDPLAEHADGAVAEWLDGAVAPALRRVEIVLASEDPDELTVRAARLLGQADCVVHPADLAPAILARARADAVRLEEGSHEPTEGLVVVLRMDR